MKRIVILAVILLACLASAAQAQQQGNQNQNGQGAKVVYYDTFNERFLDLTKWLPWGPACVWGTTYECVREIQNGRLRVATRNIGAKDSDSGFQFTDNSLNFVNPNAINSITADATLSQFNGVPCSTNVDQLSIVVLKVTGLFFNTGTLDPNDDIGNDVYLWIDVSDPKTVRVGDWCPACVGMGAYMGTYPIGTPLTLSNTWDKTNHQFIATVKITGDSGQGKRFVVPYLTSDTTPPVNPSKELLTYVYSANCSSAQTSTYFEAFFDNVIINAPPPAPITSN